MPAFATRVLPADPDVTAPDGAAVRILLQLEGGSMAHFELQPRQVSQAVVHRSVEEIWYVLDGHGEMWRRQDGRAEVTPLHPGTCLTLPQGTEFQFRAYEDGPLRAVAVTLPPWPGEGEARVVEGPWLPGDAAESG